MGEVKLPKLSEEPEGAPILIKVGYEFQADRSPKISQAYVRSNGTKLDRSVERKRSALGHEAGERITIEVITMRRIGGPVRVCVMRRDDLYPAAGFRNAMKLAHERHYIGNVFDDVAANDSIKFVVSEWIGHDAKIVDDVGVRAWIRVNANGAGKFILATTDVQNLFGW